MPTRPSRTLGFLSFTIGVTILLWFVYNQFRPTPEFRSGFQSVFQLAVPVLMVWFGWKWMLDLGPGVETLDLRPDSPELVAAAEEARRTLPRFLDALGGGRGVASVKFPLRRDVLRVDRAWGLVHHHGAGVFDVTLVHVEGQPKALAEERHVVPEGEIEDWQITRPDGSLEGAYTLRALFAHAERAGLMNRTMRRQRERLLAPLAPAP